MNMTMAARGRGVSVETFMRRMMGKDTRRLHQMCTKYPRTLRTAKLMARRNGVPLGLILERFNFSAMMRAEQWKQLSLFHKLVQRFLAMVGRNRFSPK